MANLEPLMESNFLEYASYVIVDRAIPDIRDGCKPVQRRLLYTLFEMDDGKFHKVANVIGETMKLHPHGDQSIGDALVVLANKEYFIERQGNFGSILTGHPAAASRYIECRLTPLAKDALFNQDITNFQESYDGRKKEPIFLPVKLPVLLMLGTEGIAVGMSTKILPHNLPELLQAQIAYLKYEPYELYPDFLTGGFMDVSNYEDGRGKVRVRAQVISDNEKRILIKELPYGVNTENLIASIESAAQKGRVKIASINDYTTDHVEIEIILPRGIYAEEVIPQLYAYTDCEISISSNIVTIVDKKPIQLSVKEAITSMTDHLKEQIKAELIHKRHQLEDKQHWLTLEQIFIENKIYKRIEDANSDTQVRREVYTGMREFSELFIRPLTDDDVHKLLELKIRRISKYDQDKNRNEINKIVLDIKQVTKQLQKLTETVISYLEEIYEKHNQKYPRLTQIKTFTEVDRKKITRAHLKVSYDIESGFFGTEVKGQFFQLTMSEYDRVLIISQNGSYRILGPTDKILIPDKAIYCEQFDIDKGATFTVIYRDDQKIGWAKKIHIHKFIRDREYSLIKDNQGRIDLLLPGICNDQLRLYFAPAKRQRVHQSEFDLNEVLEVSPSARGRRLSPKPLKRIELIKVQSDDQAQENTEHTQEEQPDENELKQQQLFSD